MYKITVSSLWMSGYRWRRWLPDMEGRCKYGEHAIARTGSTAWGLDTRL